MEQKKTVGMELRILSNLMKRRLDQSITMRQVEKLTGAHGWILGYLYRNQERDIYQRDLEQVFHVRRSTITAVLQLMEKNGLIARESVDNDARLKKLRLTEKAVSVHQQVMQNIDDFESKITQGISEAELAAFFEIIDKIKQNLETMEGMTDDKTFDAMCERI